MECVRIGRAIGKRAELDVALVQSAIRVAVSIPNYRTSTIVSPSLRLEMIRGRRVSIKPSNSARRVFPARIQTTDACLAEGRLLSTAKSSSLVKMTA